MTRTSGRQRWSKGIVAGLVMMGLCMAMPWSAFAAEKNSKEEPPPCPEGDHGCETDRKIRQVSDAVSEMADQGDDGRFWDISDDLKLSLHDKHPVARTIFLAPTYVMRAVTFPVAWIGDFLIRKGVVGAVVNTLSNDDRTFWVFPRFELGFGSGFGGGVGILHTDLDGEGYRFDAGYLNHINLNQSGWASLEQRNAFTIAGRPVGFRLEMNVVHNKDAQFYGIGASTNQDELAYYQVDSGTVGGRLGYEPVDHFWVGMHGFLTGDSTRPSDSAPSVETEFPPSTLAGFNGEVLYADVGLWLSYDSREAGAAPERGTLARVAFDRFQGLGAAGNDFNQYSVELMQLLRLWLPRNVLLLRTAWMYQQETGDDRVPFNRLTTLDINTPERGLPFGRYRDRGSLVFNVEYRYPVWKYADGSFFFDAGRVFHDLSGISFRHFAYAGGIGMRFRTNDYFLFRVEVAFGTEGTRALFKTSTAF